MDHWHWIDIFKVLIGMVIAWTYDAIKRWRRGKVTDAERFYLRNIEQTVLDLKMELSLAKQERDEVIRENGVLKKQMLSLEKKMHEMWVELSNLKSGL